MPAQEFAVTGLDLLPSDPPQRLAFDLNLERAECGHLAGDDAAAENFFERAFPLAADDFERAEVYERLIQFQTKQARFERALQQAENIYSILTRVFDLAAAGYHTCAVVGPKAPGTVSCWGWNADGQVNGTSGPNVMTPATLTVP